MFTPGKLLALGEDRFLEVLSYQTEKDETYVMEGDPDSIPTMTMPWVDDCDGRCAKQWGRFENYTVAMVAQHSECTGSY